MRTTLNDRGEVLIYFKHVRTFPASQGTICTIEWHGNKIQHSSILNPKDQFCKAKGRIISLTKALKVSPFTKEERRIIWNTYFANTKKIK